MDKLNLIIQDIMLTDIYDTNVSKEIKKQFYLFDMYSDEFTFILKDKKILIDYMPIDVISMLNIAVLINVDKSFMKEKK